MAGCVRSMFSTLNDWVRRFALCRGISVAGGGYPWVGTSGEAITYKYARNHKACWRL